MRFYRASFRRINVVLSTLLLVFFITSALDGQWSEAPAAAQCPTITFNPVTLPNATAGASYSQTITATGGAGVYNYTILGGALPPGLFTANGNGQGVASAIVLRIKANGAVSYETLLQYDGSQNRFVSTPIDLGASSDQVFIVFYGTGWKLRSALSAVSCSIGAENSEVLFAGEAPGFVGLDQLNARLPRSLAGRGEVDVAITVDGKVANTVRIAIR